MPMPLSDEDARRMLAEVQANIAELTDARERSEAELADTDDALVTLRRRERDLTIYLTPERSGVPRVIRKAAEL